MSAARQTSSLALVGVLLREPALLLGDASAGAHDDDPLRDRLAVLAPRLLGITVFGAAIFGLVLGSYRGDLQYAYAAIKTPMLLLIPVLIGLPAIRAFHDACEISVSWSHLALASLVSIARTAVLAAACGPILWLYLSMHPDYHRAVLAMAACLCLVGLPGLMTLLDSLPRGGRNRPLASFASVAVLGVLLAQSGWLLRPFVVRPRAEISFLRDVEADVFSSLASTGSSARGHYRGWDARGAGLLGRERQPSHDATSVEPPMVQPAEPAVEESPR
ncbi:hypothetical protein [Enhygromyxa salina]|uniref:Uncharacterized protein n=1 Tax=Enhygromyxa salina TaxID=215803 RepID=A0A2S9Y2K4_9BACT|nr:hypothetical protein [Enhygromyxa salina]PRP99343.1 hypothetical protein ENSA7_63850 [Enhygromyxa salina]